MTDHAIRTILAGTDLTDESREVIPRGLQLAKQFGARLRVVHVLDDNGAAHQEERRRVADERLARDIREAGCEGVETAFDIGEGLPGPFLCDVLDEGGDLAIIGYHRDRALEAPQLGSTMRYLLTHTGKDVLVVKEEGETPYSSALIAWDGEKALPAVVERTRAYAPDADILVMVDVPTAAQVPEMEEKLRDMIAGTLPDGSLLVRSGSVLSSLRALVDEKRVPLLVMPTRGNQGGALGYMASEILGQRLCDTLCLHESVGL
ncbi:universal stress protein [Parvularcula lutaonensis]|uniref:Universal stress protein n=1 Tax=Parvularcula lutaonensis TaxID=491923 RepID=A0ABV7MDN2_9PROT|nr:universal stress protein [Parvularcula lutaonensis]GGY52961.1 hypothetical protein GCM10007148_22730 [Parvularcula lutaonensis]